MKTRCFYHKNCMDGKAAAAVVHQEYPDAIFYPIQYGEPLLPMFTPEEMADTDLYIVDFSFPIEVMKKLKAGCHAMTWIDHHKTSIPLQEKLGWGVVDMKECGASLTWKHIYGIHNMVPMIIKYVRDRDLWLWKQPCSREVSEALAHRYPDQTWEGLLGLDPEDLFEEGAGYLEQKMKQVEKNCERAYPVVFHGHNALAVNAYEYVSETGEALLEQPEIEVAIMYWREKDKWVNSLRSSSKTPDVDVSALAKRYGGGGHAQAAGFTSLTLLHDELPLQ